MDMAKSDRFPNIMVIKLPPVRDILLLILDIGRTPTLVGVLLSRVKFNEIIVKYFEINC